MMTKFAVDKYYKLDNKPTPLVREVESIWIDETTLIRSSDSQKLFFVERYLGDRTEAWVSVVENGVERGRWNASNIQSIKFVVERTP